MQIIPNDPIEPKVEDIKRYDLDIRKLGPTRVAITLNSGTYLPAYSFTDSRYLAGGGFSIPLETAPEFYTKLKTNYSHLTFTIDDEVNKYIQSYLERERAAFLYATADDSDDISPELGPIQLRGFQKAAVKFFTFDDNNKILALDMGLGKTPIAIKTIEMNGWNALWLTKAALVPNLDREIRKCTNKSTIILNGRNPDESTYKSFLLAKTNHFILNYEVVGTEVVNEEGEVLSRPWTDTINLMAKMGKIDIIVADEAHLFKNMKAKRTKAILAMDVKRKMPLTGTPLVNRVKELYPLLNWVAPDTFHSEQSFLNTFDDGYGNAKDPRALQKALQPYLFRRAKKDVLKDLPAITRITHSVTLSPFHKKRYEDALDMLYRTIEGDEYEINNVLAQLTRLRQIVADAKVDHTIDYVKDTLENTDDKLLIFSNFTDPVRHIANELKCNAIYGDVHPEKRMQYVDDFNNNPSSRSLVLSIATGQEGLNLTAAKIVVFNDLSFVPKDHTQAEARCYGRMNDLHGATSVWLSIMKTVDDLLLNMIHRKMQRFEEAIEGTKVYQDAQESIMREFISALKNSR